MAFPDPQQGRVVVEFQRLDGQSLAEVCLQELRNLRGTVLGRDATLAEIEQSASGMRTDKAQTPRNQNHAVSPIYVGVLNISLTDDQFGTILRGWPDRKPWGPEQNRPQSLRPQHW